MKHTEALPSGQADLGPVAGELVLLPSAMRPGTWFAAITTPEIRLRNVERWRRGRERAKARRFGNIGQAWKTSQRRAA